MEIQERVGPFSGGGWVHWEPAVTARGVYGRDKVLALLVFSNTRTSRVPSIP